MISRFLVGLHHGKNNLFNEASPFRVSLHTSCTGAQKRRSQNETMMVLSPSTLSFEQRYSLNRIQELNTTTYLDGLPDQFNLMFSFPEMGPKHVGRRLPDDLRRIIFSSIIQYQTDLGNHMTLE